METTIKLRNPARGFLIEVTNNIKFMSILSYFRETQGELAHVNWPSKRQSVIFSVVVILISVAVAAFLGAFDLIFSRALNLFIS